jgi:hypothetical protein
VPGISGIEHAGDDAPRPLLHRRPFGLLDIDRPIAGERLVEARFGRILGDHAADCLLMAGQHRAGQDMAAAQRLLGDRQRLLVEPRILLDPDQVAFIIGPGPERQIVGHAGKALVPAKISGEEHVALGMGITFDDLLQIPLEDRAVGAVIGVEPGRRYPLETRQECPRLPHPAFARSRAQIVDPAVMVAHPERRRRSRVLAQKPGIMIGEQTAQLVHRSRGGWRRGQQGCGNQQKGDRTLHGGSPVPRQAYPAQRTPDKPVTLAHQAGEG